MKHLMLMLMLLGGLSVAACTDDPERGAITTDETRSDVREGGPEEGDTAESRYESAVPEWEEREAGEVADGDR